MSALISLLIALWLAKAAIDILIGIFEIIVGLMAALFGVAILAMIFITDALVMILRIAFQKNMRHQWPPTRITWIRKTFPKIILN